MWLGVYYRVDRGRIVKDGKREQGDFVLTFGSLNKTKKPSDYEYR